MPGTPPSLTSSKSGLHSKISATAIWKEQNHLEMTWQFFETPHHDIVSCRFDGQKITIEFLNSISRLSPGHKELRPVLVGALA